MPRPWYARRELELALVAVVTALAAIGVNAAIRVAADDLPPAPPQAATAAPRIEPLEAYAPIAARDVFNLAPAASPSADGSLRLVGVGFQGGEARAVVEDATSHHQDLVRAGDAIAGGRVVSIAWDHVVLATPRGEAVLALAPAKERTPEPAAEPAVAADTSGASVRQTSATAFVVDRRALIGAAEDPSGLLTQLRAVAEVQDGRPSGFRLFQMKDDSIFRRLGLQNGDVVQRVNGEPLADPTHLLGFLQRLRTEPRVALDIRRGPERRTLVYDLR
jgi:general secretion pathway protein C